MSTLILFGIGIVAGLIAAFRRGPGRRFVFLHVLVGIVGAMVGGVLVARLLGDKAYHPDHFDAGASAWAAGGALLFLALAKLIGAALARRAG
ncbi:MULTISPECIES: hypothetical protein [unclassified Sphingomonas]|uniref:hypothetical protein n=1 Tax=unclassified Sphingomonas TaxID=196159 RepID=UPI0022B5A138|nr:hypothetical protein [Sphingomonas sp. NIBR02145]WHU04368.1 hypothetical protein O3305_07200 [Sphingomonas sp. NIBR02145]